MSDSRTWVLAPLTGIACLDKLSHFVFENTFKIKEAVTEEGKIENRRKRVGEVNIDRH